MTDEPQIFRIPGGSIEGCEAFPGLSFNLWKPKGEEFTREDFDHLRLQLGIENPTFTMEVEASNCVEGRTLTATV